MYSTTFFSYYVICLTFSGETFTCMKKGASTWVTEIISKKFWKTSRLFNACKLCV